MHLWAPFWLCLLTISFVKCQANYKVCAQSFNLKDCDQLSRNGLVHCNTNAHSVDCLINIDEGRTDFGRVTAEEALLAAPLTNNLVVVGEFRSNAIFDDSNYATVVLVRRNYTGGFQNFKGKKYCHPGFKYDSTVTDFLLKEFENKVLKENNAEGCGNLVSTATILEKELKSLTDYFGPSCRPGPWIDMEEVNSKYYNKYSKLCQFCNNGCDTPDGAAPFIQSLDCLVRGGDVSLSTLNSVHEYFNRSENIQKQVDYGYLCFDGSVNPLNNPCVWSKQPWDLLVAQKDKASALKDDFGNHWFPKDVIQNLSTNRNNNATLDAFLKPIINPSGSGVKLLDSGKSLKEYMEEYRRVIPNSLTSEKCRQNVKWCTVSKEEQTKCQWLAQASVNRAIQPVLSCVQSPDKFSCLHEIKTGSADVVTSDAHYGYIARRKKLAPIAYPETFESYDLIKTIVVIKNNDLSIKRFGNLKNKKACISEYGGVEWLSFINTAREHGVMNKKICDYGELLSDFLSDSCVPGALDPEHENSATTDHGKLCNLCMATPNYTATHTLCNANYNNKYYGSEGALKCLQESGDFAVITKKEYPNFKADDFRVLCKNGDLAPNTGFNVSDECALATIVDSEVITNMNGSKNADIASVLLNFEKRFGSDRIKAFEIFNTFNNTKDLLFKDTTRGLAKVSSPNQYILNYLKLFEHVDKCVRDGKGGSMIVEPTIFCIILSCIVLFFQRL